MSAENIFGPEYMANAHRHDMTVKCLDMLRRARSVAVLPIAWHLEKAIAAAEGALAGYSWRDDELYIEATKGIPPGMIPRRGALAAFEEIEQQACRGQSMSPHSRGWERMWAVIAATYGDTVCAHEGEAWQYMGSFSEDDGATWTHEFRHRSLPPDGGRAYAKVPGTADDFEETIGA